MDAVKAIAVVTWILIVSISLVCETRPLDGYQFPVYTTEFCPRDKTEWNKRSVSLNCTKQNGYMCLPNENFTYLLEFCYVLPSILIEKGLCLFLFKHHSIVDAFDCQHFTEGCPKFNYRSNEVYKYSSCLSIANGCFLDDPICGRTTKVDLSTKTVHPTQFLQASHSGSGTYQNDLILIIPLTCVLFLICACITTGICCIYWKKKREIYESKTCNESEKLMGMETIMDEKNIDQGHFSVWTDRNQIKSIKTSIDNEENVRLPSNFGISSLGEKLPELEEHIETFAIDQTTKKERYNEKIEVVSCQIGAGISNNADTPIHNEEDRNSPNLDLALSVACENGNNQIVLDLLHNGANVNSITEGGANPLILACQNGHDGTVQTLLNNGADVNFQGKNNASPLHRACHNEHESIVHRLVENGANVNLCQIDGASPLLIACQNGNESIARFLLNNGADINLCHKEGVSPLYIACQNGHDTLARFLLNKGAGIDLCRKDGVSPLLIASQNEHANIVQILLNAGAKVNLCTEEGQSPLFAACRTASGIIVQCLLDNGADVNACMRNGMSTVFNACFSGQFNNVLSLLNHGADVNLCMENGASPLFIACEIGHDEIVKLLLKNGANINSCMEDGVSPLYIACYKGHCSTVQLLLQNNADKNMCHRNGSSPLSVACEKGFNNIARMLMEN